MKNKIYPFWLVGDMTMVQLSLCLIGTVVLVVGSILLGIQDAILMMSLIPKKRLSNMPIKQISVGIG